MSKKMGRPTSYHPDMLPKILELGALGKTKTQIAVALGITTETLYQWMKKNDDFSDAVNQAAELSEDYWIEGLKKAAFGEVKNASAPLLIFMMKNIHRKNFADRQEITGADGAPLLDDTATASRIAELIELAQLRKEQAIVDVSTGS